MRFSLLFTSFVLLLLHSVSNSVAVTEYHRCIHDMITRIVGPPEVDLRRSHVPTTRKNEVLSADGALKEPERINASDGWEHIRIRIFADDLKKEGRYCATDKQKVLNDFGENIDCTSEDVLTPEKKDILLNTILEEAIQLHTERLYVEPLKGNLVVPRFKAGNICANFTVPEEHRTDGVPDADLVLYVSAVPHKMQLQRTFGWAVTCATLDDKRGRISHPGRPVVGVMNYAPRHILSTTLHVRVAAHEIAHALGFSVNEMKRLEMLKDMVKDEEKVRGKKRPVSLVSSPNTLRETWLQYNCNTTKGMELEDEVPPWFQMVHGGGKGPANNRGPYARGTVHGVEGRGPHQQNPGRGRGEGPFSAGRGPNRGPEGGQPRQFSPRIERNARESRSSSSSLDVRNGEFRSQRVQVHQNVRENSGPSTENLAARTRPASSLTAQITDVQDATIRKKVVAVEKQRDIPGPLPLFSHWKRRNAKDELMAGIVGAGYYTALTMAAFADLRYYMVDWSKAERMSWGNHSGCQLLDEKCVNNSQTQYPDMFCTTKPTDDTPLQCTSDRHALGTCLLMNLKEQLPRNLLPLSSPFQYFVETDMGSPPRELMDHCPFITANSETWCTDGDKEKMSGSIIAPNSRCVKGEELKVKEKNIGDVCVKVSCRNGTVSVKYKGNDKWHACAEGTKLNVDTTELKGRIVCPKYDDVCNTINRTLDELEGPPPPSPPPKPETQPETPKAKNPTTAAAKNPTAPTAQGTTVGTTTTTTTTSTPSTQGTATPNKQESVTHNGNTKSATATGKASAGALGSKKNATTIDTNAMPALTSTSMNSGVSIEIPSTDVVAAPAAALFGPFVCFLLVTTMVAVS